MEILEKASRKSGSGAGSTLSSQRRNHFAADGEPLSDPPARIGACGRALAAAWIGKQIGQESVIASTWGDHAKTCIIQDGDPIRVNEFEVARCLPL